EREWAQAEQLLKGARQDLTADRALTNQIDVYLGRCYEHLQDPVQMESAFQRVLGNEPGSVQARLGVASALWQQGKRAESLVMYRRVLDGGGVDARHWVDLAALEVQHQLLSDDKKRDWSDAERALAEAAKALPSSSRVVLLRAEVLVARDKADEADAL